MEDKLVFGSLGPHCLHLCVDMQRIFAEETEWHMPWMKRILPQVSDIMRHHTERTVCTRFLPAKKPAQGQGTWKRYYEKWASMTEENIDPALLELIPEISAYMPETIDKHVYGPWVETDLHARLRKRDIDTLVITGGEIDVCVLATVLGAVDFGYRVILATDALCSSSDETYDAMMKLFHHRYATQVETASTETILRQWT